MPRWCVYKTSVPLIGSLTRFVGQIGLIAFRRDFLIHLMSLPPTPLERTESVDMLRAVEYGFPVRMIATRYATHPVDTAGDLARVETLMRGDPLVPTYGLS